MGNKIPRKPVSKEFWKKFNTYKRRMDNPKLFTKKEVAGFCYKCKSLIYTHPTNEKGVLVAYGLVACSNLDAPTFPTMECEYKDERNSRKDL